MIEAIDQLVLERLASLGYVMPDRLRDKVKPLYDRGLVIPHECWIGTDQEIPSLYNGYGRPTSLALAEIDWL